MTNDTRRITLLSRDHRSAPRAWDMSPSAASRVIAVESLLALRYAVDGGLSEIHRDVERVVLDRTTSASQYLAFLASFQPQFTGDVLLIVNDDSGFLSSTGRGGDRVLYALDATDVRFYLEMNGLVADRIETQISPALPMIYHHAAHASA